MNVKLIIARKLKPWSANFLSDLLLQLFQFAKNHRGLYQNSIPSARSFYSSSGDEVGSTSLINVIIMNRNIA